MCIEKGVKMKSLVAMLVGLNILLFAGVGSWFGSWFGGNNDNYDNEKILIRDSSSYSYWEKDGVADSETANIKFSFTGNDVIWKMDASKAANVECAYNVNISSGKFKIIEITTDKKIKTLWENTDGNKANGSFTISLNKGTSRIKIVGKKAKGSLTMTLTPNENVNVEAISYSQE